MAGRLNLAITGIQDQWLTGEPEFSYFLMNFRRHTKFSIESIETPFDGDVDYDATVECRIPKNKGDLIRSMMIKFTLPKPTEPDKSFTVTAAGGKYFIDGVQQATLTLYEGTTYTFNNLSHVDGHPFRFSTTASPNYSDYTTGVTDPRYSYCYICRTSRCTINFILLLCCTLTVWVVK